MPYYVETADGRKIFLAPDEVIASAAEIATLRDEVERLRAALAFARSVIKSGEPWTETCERVIDGALNSVR